jgi:ATP-dependent exoDNAse (exonuclease V) beta subunit
MHGVFVEAAAGATSVSWPGVSTSHVMRVCPPAGQQIVAGPTTAGTKTNGNDSDFLALEDETVKRVTVSELSGVDRGETVPRFDAGNQSDRSIGIVVHRLLQRTNFDTELSDEQLRPMAASILSGIRTAELGDVHVLMRTAITSFRQVAARDDIRELYRSGRADHEVAFTMRSDGRIIRGTIDCLIASNDRVTVLEFKTGKPRAEHRAQAEVYRAAAEALFPGVPIESRLVYTSGSAID